MSKHREHCRMKKIRRHEERENRLNRQVTDVVQDTREKVSRATNISHTIPKARAREGYEVWAPENLVRKPIEEHNMYHKIFGIMTPKEVLRWVHSFVNTVLSDEADKKLEELDNMEERQFYIPSVIK